MARAFWSCGLACSLLSTTVFSFSSLFVKMTGGRVPVLQVAATRSIISFIISVALARAQGPYYGPLYGSPANRKWLLLRGVFGALAMTTYYVSIFSLPLADAVTIGLIQPPLTALVAWLALREVFGWRGASGCLACLAGVVVVAHPPFLFGGEGWSVVRAVGVGMDVLSCFLGAVAVTIIRLIGRQEHAVTVALWFHTCVIVMCLLPLAAGWPQQPVVPLLTDLALLVGVALTSFCGQLLMTRGLQLIPAAQASATSFAQIIFSNLWGFLFFAEPLTTSSTAGAVLIVIGVLIVTSTDASSKAQPTSHDTSPRSAAERAHSLLHKLLVKCPQCGMTNETLAPHAHPPAITSHTSKQPLLASGFTMEAAAAAPAAGLLQRSISEAQQLLSEAAAGSEVCTGRSVHAPPAGGAPLLCRTCSVGLHADDRSMSAATGAMYSARSSFARTGSSVGDFSIASHRGMSQDVGDVEDVHGAAGGEQQQASSSHQR